MGKGKKNQGDSGEITDAPLADLRVPQLYDESYKEAQEDPDYEMIETKSPPLL
jgi:hypothetical protein